MSKISVSNLTFSYNEKKVVLKGVSFSIENGSYVSIVGHNGSGKSTLAKLLIGLLDQSDGKIFYDGQEVTKKNIAFIRRKIGLVFQNPDNQFIGATVEDDIAFGLENKCVPTKEMYPIIKEFAEEVGVLDYLKKEPSMLSGGQKQRVAIAGALALSPEVIIFDEATSMLDPKAKKHISDLIIKLRKQNPELTIISITHDIEEAFKSDKVIVLNKGEIVMEGKPIEVLSNREKLVELGLDIPFVLDFENVMASNGVKIDSLDIDSIVEEVWASK